MKRLAFLLLVFSASFALGQPICTRALSGVNYVTASTYAFVSADTTRITNFNNASGIAVTLASGISNSEFGACAEITTFNGGVGEVDITCSGCTINGSSILKLESMQSADIYGDGQNYIALVGNSASPALSYANSSDGTTCNGLAKIDSTSGSSTLGKATSTAAGDQLPILGVVISGCGTSGNASIITSGSVQVLFDTPSITVGDAVGISTSVAAEATDVGSASSASVIVIGLVTLSPSGGSPSACTVAPGCWILLKPAGSGGGGNSANAVVTNPGATQTVTPTSATATPINQVCNSSAGSSQVCGQITNSSGNPVIQGLNNGQANIGYGTTHNWGSGVSSNSDLNGELTASSNTASYSFTGTYTSHPICTASDETSRNAVQVTYTGTTSVTFTTSGSTDVVSYQCTFRN
jgi:hypothetical protein